MIALALARRGLRGGVRGLGIIVLCLALGVGAIAAVGSLRAAVSDALARSGRALLGGDVEIDTGAEVPPPGLTRWLASHGARTSDVTEMRTILIPPAGLPALIDLRAVDAAWPLIGHAKLAPPLPLARALGRQASGLYGLLVDPVTLAQLHLYPGEFVQIGVDRFEITAALASEPDRLAGPALFGAPAIITAAALPATGIDVPGAFVSHQVRAAWAEPEPWRVAEVRAAFANHGWRVRGAGDVDPGLQRALTQTALFLTLVGLSALLVGGVGAASGVRAWLDARTETLATLRCLGATSRMVFAVAALQVAALASVGILAGLAIGAITPAVARGWIGSLLPVSPTGGVYAGPLALAALYGILTCAVFALPALSRALHIPGAALFRDLLLPEQARPSLAILAITGALALALVALAMLASADRRFAIAFCGAALFGLMLFRLGGSVLVRLLRRLPLPTWAPARLGFGNLRQPGTATPLLLTAVGLGLATLAAVVLVEGNIRRAVMDQIPADAPSLYFIDLQPEQVAPFNAILRATKGVAAVEEVPSMRARIVAVNGVAAADVRASPDSRWALRGDRGLTYSAIPPKGSEIIAGRWWSPSYDGPPLVSLDAQIARGWGIGLGAVIRINVLGRDLDLRVANLRRSERQRIGLHFLMVASPGMLSGAPHTVIATVRLPRDQEAALIRRVVAVFPNVTPISVAAILKQLGQLIGQMSAALAATSSVTLASGVLVLIGAVAAGRRRRTEDAVVLRALGATGSQLRLAWLIEFGLLGLVAGMLAAIAGVVASWGIMHAFLGLTWVFLPMRLAATVMGALALMLVFGYLGTAAALRAKPAARLRND